jgi:hypothetical protein
VNVGAALAANNLADRDEFAAKACAERSRRAAPTFPASNDPGGKIFTISTSSVENPNHIVVFSFFALSAPLRENKNIYFFRLQLNPGKSVHTHWL